MTTSFVLRCALLAAALVLGPASTAAQSRAPGFSAGRLARIDSLFRRYVDEGRAAGAVALVLRHGRVAYQGAFGWADREAGRRMTPDAIFRIASQTKALTSVAVMMLVEEGRLGLNHPVSRYLPNYARTSVAVPGDTGRVITPAKRPITIRDLLTHTAGISYGTDARVAPLYQAAGLGPAAGYGWYTADKSEAICDTMDRLGTLPFVAQPGEAFVYGYNTDILGCVVERVSGLPLDRFVRERITDPLGMLDTHFFLPPAKRERLAAVYAIGADGRVERAPDGARGQGHYTEGPRASFSGGAGLLSTAADYARFLQMLLNRGQLAGRRLLAPRTVELMTSNQVGTLFPGGDGAGFGLGFQTTDRLGAGGGFASVGSYGWGGAYNSRYLVDPAAGLVLVFMSQHLPSGGLDLADRFFATVYAAATALSPLPTTSPSPPGG
jgi:CubicO group peptidase (beta-lactamase class C family)